MSTACQSAPQRFVPNGEVMLQLSKIGLFLASGANLARYLRVRGRIMRRLGTWGLYERDCLHFLQQVIRPGNMVIDVGANLGVYTMAMARLVGPKGMVWAFEPQVDVYRELCESTTRLSQVQVFPFALTDKPCEIEMFVPKLMGMLPEPALASAEGKGRCGIKSLVQGVPLDSLIDRVEGLTFIKVDIEGHEVSFLEGAREIIARFRPTIQLEWLDRERPDDFLSQWLIRYNYHAGYVGQRGTIQRWKPADKLPASTLNVYLFPR